MVRRETSVQTCSGTGNASAPIPAKENSLISPLRLGLIIAVVIIAVVIIASEIISHVVLPHTKLPTTLEILAHLVTLLLLLVPAYIFVIRPYWRAHLESTAEIKKLNQQLLMAAEQERDRLAAELHDDAAQYLTALRLAIGTLACTTTPAVSDKNLNHLTQLVEETHERVRQVVTKLRLPDLNAGGLVQVLRELIERCAQLFPQVQFDFSNHGCHDGKYPLIDIVLYRVCQESICNAVRHGEATRIHVTFSCASGHLILEIIDNGRGFNPGAQKLNGYGIDGMRKRLAAVGGTLVLKSELEHGTHLTATIPKTQGGRDDPSVCCR